MSESLLLAVIAFLLLFSAYLGTLEFSLLFDQENNCLHCTIHKAKVTMSIDSPYKQTSVGVCARAVA